MVFRRLSSVTGIGDVAHALTRATPALVPALGVSTLERSRHPALPTHAWCPDTRPKKVLRTHALRFSVNFLQRSRVSSLSYCVPALCSALAHSTAEVEH